MYSSADIIQYPDEARLRKMSTQSIGRHVTFIDGETEQTEGTIASKQRLSRRMRMKLWNHQRLNQCQTKIFEEKREQDEGQAQSTFDWLGPAARRSENTPTEFKSNNLFRKDNDETSSATRVWSPTYDVTSSDYERDNNSSSIDHPLVQDELQSRDLKWNVKDYAKYSPMIPMVQEEGFRPLIGPRKTSQVVPRRHDRTRKQISENLVEEHTEEDLGSGAKAYRRNGRPTQGDWVLIREMEPNRPDIARLASETVLNSDSSSEEENEETSTKPLIILPSSRIDSGLEKINFPITIGATATGQHLVKSNVSDMDVDRNFGLSGTELFVNEDEHFAMSSSNNAGFAKKLLATRSSQERDSSASANDCIEEDSGGDSGHNEADERFTNSPERNQIKSALTVKKYSSSPSLDDPTAPEIIGSDVNENSLINPRKEILTGSDDEVDYPYGKSSYASSNASIFSLNSYSTNATDVSLRNGYSPHQIAFATQELLAIILEDEDISSSLEAAIKDSVIGPERLRRNLRRMFKAYAELLKEEAKERIELSISRLVLIKSRFLAESIVDKLSGKLMKQIPPGAQVADLGDSSDSDGEGGYYPVSEEVFEDISILHEFLLGSRALAVLRKQIRSFVDSSANLDAPLNQASRSKVQKDHVSTLCQEQRCEALHKATWTAILQHAKRALNYFLSHGLLVSTDSFLITMKLLEPALSQDKTRLRWTSVCHQDSASV